MSGNTLVFSVNGEKREILNADPRVILADYLRTSGLTGTKIGCGEGGCGACTVNLATWDAATGKPKYRSANACLVPLCSLDGQAVTTIEGLGNSKRGFHPLQERLAEFNGSQCGYCSPGMVMAMYNFTKKKPEQTSDKAQIERCLDGNLCRCTGYRPILDAFKSVADAPYDQSNTDPVFPEFLKTHAVVPKSYECNNSEWHSPVSLAQLLQTLATTARGGDVSVNVVSGHTAKGIYKASNGNQNWYQKVVLVDVSRVPEMRGIVDIGGTMQVGAAATIDEFINACWAKGTQMHQMMGDHANRIGGTNMRGQASVGGNIMITKRFAFQSDLATLLCGANSSVAVASAAEGEKEVPLLDFLQADFRMAPDAVITRLTVPAAQPNEHFRSMKVGKRPADSYAVVNGAFVVTRAGANIESARLVFGAFKSGGAGGSGGPVRALNTEKVMAGKAPDQATQQAAMAALRTEPWWPTDDYEMHVIEGFLFKLFSELRGGPVESEEMPVRVSQAMDRPVSRGEQKIDWFLKTNQEGPVHVPMTKYNAKLQTAGEQLYVGDMAEPATTLHGAYVKIGQAGAELTGVDIDDAMKLPGVKRVLTAADVPGDNVADSFGLPEPKAIRLLVPNGEMAQFSGQPCALVLAETAKQAQLAALAVSVNTKPGRVPLMNVDEALKAATSNTAEIPVAGEHEDLLTPMEKIGETRRGDADAALRRSKKVLSGEAVCGTQKHFYMEPNGALCTPTGDGKVEITMSAQVPTWCHEAVSRALGVQKNKIVVRLPEAIGGGFGGKLLRGLHTGVAAAVGASVTGQPVKMVLDRNTDMEMTGGRADYRMKYQVGFDDQTGKIDGIRVRFECDAGWGDAFGGLLPDIVMQTIEQAYDLPNITTEGFAAYTSKTPHTAMRGPGEIQGSYFIETIIEHVATTMGVSPQKIREANLFATPADQAAAAKNPTAPDVDQYSAQYQRGNGTRLLHPGDPAEGFPDHPIGGMWEYLKQTQGFDAREKAINEFNQQHKWRKRGIAMTPVRYRVGLRGQNVLLCLYTDGTALITTDGTEIGQGLHTKVAQFAAYHLSQIVPGAEPVPVSAVRCGPNGTDKVAIGSLTGGSTTSEGCCVAALDAINKIKAMLEPHIKRMMDDPEIPKPLTFQGVLADATAAQMLPLQASGVCSFNNADNVAEGGWGYCIFGCAMSEVEVDVITGETTILTSKILYDCGQSLNPMIDCGQAEGGFMQGVGFFLREKVEHSPTTGELLTNGTWEYKIPGSQDQPLDFGVEFFPRPFEKGVNKSKGSGEPPLVLAASVFMAVRQAIGAGRKDFGHSPEFRLDTPATSKDIALAIGANMGGSVAKM